MILAAAAAVISCVENDRTLGEGMLPDESVINLGVKTFDLPVTNQVSDSMQAGNTVTMLLGTVTDPVFGTAISNTASYVLPYSDTTDFGESPRLLSAYMTLSIDSISYMDENQKGIHQRIRIYKLTSPLDSTIGFCNSITPDDYDPVPVTLSDPVIYGEGEIRVDLTEAYAQELLSTTPEEFADVDLFLEKIHGLYIEVQAPLGTAEGGRMNYLNLGTSTININYILNNPDRGFTDKDTTESFAFGYSSAFNYFSTGSEHLADNAPAEELYLEGLSGIKPHISAAELKDMLDSWIEESGLDGSLIILSRAELVFPYSTPEDYGRFDRTHPSAIYAFTRDPLATYSEGYYAPLESVYTAYNKGDINRSLQQYSMDITSYIQNLILTDRDNIDGTYDLWIAPLTSRTNLADNVLYEVDNYNYSTIVLNGPASERRPTLTITYGLMER